MTYAFNENQVITPNDRQTAREIIQMIIIYSKLISFRFSYFYKYNFEFSIQLQLNGFK